MYKLRIIAIIMMVISVVCACGKKRMMTAISKIPLPRI